MIAPVVLLEQIAYHVGLLAALREPIRDPRVGLVHAILRPFSRLRHRDDRRLDEAFGGCLPRELPSFLAVSEFGELSSAHAILSAHSSNVSYGRQFENCKKKSFEEPEHQHQTTVKQNWGSGTLMKGINHIPLPGEFACRE